MVWSPRSSNSRSTIGFPSSRSSAATVRTPSWRLTARSLPPQRASSSSGSLRKRYDPSRRTNGRVVATRPFLISLGSRSPSITTTFTCRIAPGAPPSSKSGRICRIRIRIRQKRPDFEEGGAPGAILHVKVVVIDGDRLPREIKNGRVATTLPFVRLEGSYLFLSDPDEDDALWGGKLRAVRRHEGVLTVAALERDEGNPMVLRELLDRGDQTIVSGSQQRGGRHGVSQIVVEEVAQTA